MVVSVCLVLGLAAMAAAARSLASPVYHSYLVDKAPGHRRHP